MAHSSESLALDQVEYRYFMQKIQNITIGIVNKLSFWLKYGVSLLQGSPLGAACTPLVVRFRPGHLNMTQGNPKS